MADYFLAAIFVALIPAPLLLINCRQAILNPAFYVFLIFSFSAAAKVAYFWLFYQPYRPLAVLPDRVLVFEKDYAFLWNGILMAGVAAAAYVAGYLVYGRHLPSAARRSPASASVGEAGPNRWRGSEPFLSQLRTGTFLVALACVISFALFLYFGGYNPFGHPISAKRFLNVAMGEVSRFQLVDYYFFKLSQEALPLAALTFFVWNRKAAGRARWPVVAFCLALALAAYITFFANFRLTFMILIMQLLLLVSINDQRKRLPIALLLLAVLFAHTAGVTMLRPDLGTEQQSEVDAARKAHTRLTCPFSNAALWQLCRAGRQIMEARYFLDVAKLGHIARHFPEKHDYLYGTSWREMTVPGYTAREKTGLNPQALKNSSDESDIPVSVRRTQKPDTDHLAIRRYLAINVFKEPSNNITAGIVSTLYINFSYYGVIAGLFLIGIFHRMMFNITVDPKAGRWFQFAGIMALPTSTLLLFNSGIIPFSARIFTDLMVIPACLVAAAIWSYIGLPRLGGARSD